MEVHTDDVIATVKLLSVKFKEASPEPVIRAKQPKRIQKSEGKGKEVEPCPTSILISYADVPGMTFNRAYFKAVNVINKKVKTKHLTLNSTNDVVIIVDTANNNVIAAEAIVDCATKIGLTLLMAQKNLALLKTELGNLDYQLAYILHQHAHTAQEVARFEKHIILLKAKASSLK